MSASTLIIRFLIISSILFLIDWYVFQGIKTLTNKISSERTKQFIHWTFFLSTVFLVSAIIIGFKIYGKEGNPPPFLFKLMSVLLMLVVPKLLFTVILLLEDIFRILFLFLDYLKIFFISVPDKTIHLADRRKFISQIALGIASIPFAAIAHGIAFGKYKFRVIKKDIFSEHLPEEFDGFTITQLSDIHCGSFDNKEAIERGVKMASDQNSDIILFTGDLVNNKAIEMLPWIKTFNTLKAPHGVHAILGNHDYGDYVQWDSPKEKENNLTHLKEIIKETGFNLLLNQNIEIKKGESKISLIGVENWGLPPFPQKGDLKKASQGVVNSSFKILMSHDPSHWDAQVLKSEMRYDLTLSGHTHGMQFGIEIPGIRWSPVKYRYSRWADLFEESGKYLYVNRGFGFIGFHGRVGIWPEITVLTLRKKTV